MGCGGGKKAKGVSTKHQTSHDRDKLARWLRRTNRSQNAPVDGANWLIPYRAKEHMKHRPYEADFGLYGAIEDEEAGKDEGYTQEARRNV